MLLRNWYSKLQSAVRWNNFVGVWFPILCGVPQGGVLSPYLFAFYVDDLIAWLKQSGYVIHISQVFFGCLLYADDIALLSPSCHGLQKLIDIFSKFDSEWDIKFNPSKSQITTYTIQYNTIQYKTYNAPYVTKMLFVGAWGKSPP